MDNDREKGGSEKQVQCCYEPVVPLSTASPRFALAMAATRSGLSVAIGFSFAGPVL